jgi:hypothetical protein
MTDPQAIARARERLDSAGARLRDRPKARTLDSLAAVLDAWSGSDSPWQRRLVRELPGVTGFSEGNVREGLACGLTNWSGDALRERVERELGASSSSAVGFDRTSVLLAGSIPMPTILSLLTPLLLHSTVLAKTASRDPVTAHVFAESLAEIDPELAAALEVVTFSSSDSETSEAFLDAECVVATGSDETLATVSKKLSRKARLVGYGHRLSIAALGAQSLTPEALPGISESIALDVALWDQLGCLSPVAIFCETADSSQTEQLADELAKALEKIEERLPRGELPVAAAAAIRSEREGAEMRRAAGSKVSCRGASELRFTVVREADAEWRPAPLHRFVRIHPCADRSALLTAIEPLGSHLAAVAAAGFGGEHDELALALTKLGASRICPPGTMQQPPFGWHHDGQALLPPLCRTKGERGES